MLYVVLFTELEPDGLYAMPMEADIQADVEGLRSRFSETQVLYREVCGLLFFRYGITPTANKLYQYVRRGSMSAPAEALAKFWSEMREKSQVRIEQPDLPDALKSAAGEMVASLWTQAQTAAREGLAVFKAEAIAAVQKAKDAQATAESGRAAVQQELDQIRQELRAATQQSLVLERDLAGERATKNAMAAQLNALEIGLGDARREFATELEKWRSASQRTEERCEAAEKRALLEIDRERTASAKLQQELLQNRQLQRENDKKYRTDVAQLQHDLTAGQRQAGLTEGMLQEMRTRCQQQHDELLSLRTLVTEGKTRQGFLENELNVCRKNLAKLAKAADQKKRAVTPKDAVETVRKRSRKTITENGD